MRDLFSVPKNQERGTFPACLHPSPFPERCAGAGTFSMGQRSGSGWELRGITASGNYAARGWEQLPLGSAAFSMLPLH